MTCCIISFELCQQDDRQEADLLAALEVFEGEIEGRFGEQNGNELLADIEGEGAFSVRNLGAGDGGLIAGGLETMLPFAAALEEVGDSDIELLSFIEVFAGKILGA